MPIYRNVISVACDEEYWKCNAESRPLSIQERQDININNGAKIVHQNDRNIEWLCHIDSDELLFLQNNDSSFLKRDKVDAFRMEVMEAVSERLSYEHIFSPNRFKVNVGKRRLRLARKLGCKKAIYDKEYFRGHTSSKMFVRITDNVVRYGIHGPSEVLVPLNVQELNEISLLHFDCVGFDAWHSKWIKRIDGSGKAMRMRRNRRSQYSEFSDALSIGRDALEMLYSRLHIIPRYEKAILYCLGMIKTIHLTADLLECKEAFLKSDSAS